MNTSEFMGKVALLNSQREGYIRELRYLHGSKDNVDTAYIGVKTHDFHYDLSPDAYDEVIELLIKNRERKIKDLDDTVKKLLSEFVSSSQNVIASL